jgi:hypothetical protein
VSGPEFTRDLWCVLDAGANGCCGVHDESIGIDVL